jgi:hypothetical protein
MDYGVWNVGSEFVGGNGVIFSFACVKFFCARAVIRPKIVRGSEWRLQSGEINLRAGD